MGKLNLEILDADRKNIFSKLLAFKTVGYLAGGTALALQIGHRLSYDFDIFCTTEISTNFPAKIKSVFPVKAVLINSQDEFTFLTEGDIKISFIYYPFDLEKYLIKNDNWPLDILSPLGVALAKAYALNRRNSWRDYLDLYILLKNKEVALDKIISGAQKIYGEIFNEKLFLAQLIYTEDIPSKEIAETQLFSEQVSLAEVKDFFQKEMDRYLSE